MKEKIYIVLVISFIVSGVIGINILSPSPIVNPGPANESVSVEKVIPVENLTTVVVEVYNVLAPYTAVWTKDKDFINAFTIVINVVKKADVWVYDSSKPISDFNPYKRLIVPIDWGTATTNINNTWRNYWYYKSSEKYAYGDELLVTVIPNKVMSQYFTTTQIYKVISPESCDYNDITKEEQPVIRVYAPPTFFEEEEQENEGGDFS